MVFSFGSNIDDIIRTYFIAFRYIYPFIISYKELWKKQNQNDVKCETTIQNTQGVRI